MLIVDFRLWLENHGRVLGSRALAINNHKSTINNALGHSLARILPESVRKSLTPCSS